MRTSISLLLLIASFVLGGCSDERKTRRPDEVADPGKEEIQISVTPVKVELKPSATQRFEALVSGTSDIRVEWSVEGEDAGVVDDDGLYTAPSREGEFTVTVASVADPEAKAVAKVVVQDTPILPTVSVKVEPKVAELETGEKKQFSATVEGTDDARVVWAVAESKGGSITQDGLYTAPASAGTFTILVSSAADPAKFDSAKVTVVKVPGPVVVRVEPAEVEVTANRTAQFTAVVTGGSGSREVMWAIAEPDGGVISVTGLYTAPGSAGDFKVVATSVEDPSKSATARVSVLAPPGLQGLLPDDRDAEWNPGLNAVGGIPADDDPVRPATIYRPAGNPYGPYSVDPQLAGTESTRAIQAALDAAGREASEFSRRVVFLPPGTFTIGRDDGLEIPSYVTLRGSGAQGPDATRLVKPNDTQRAVITAGQMWLKWTTPIDLAQDVAHGSRKVTLARDPGYRVGELVFIDQLDDEVNVGSKWNPVNQGPGVDDGTRRWYSRQDRPTGQVLEIEAIDGATITFSTPIRLPYLVSNRAQLVRFSGDREGGPVVPTQKWMGIEDLYLRRGEMGTINFIGASYSWAKNVEAEESFGSSVQFTYSFRNVLRDSFIHTTGWPHPGGNGYGLDVTTYSSDNLIENNIFWSFNKVVCMRASGGGNVIGYNYFEDGFGGDYPNTPEVGLNASHFATAHHELFEGNQAWSIGGDSYWGNALTITFFRNHVTGRRRSVPPLVLTDANERRFVDVAEWHFNYTFIGNVLGYQGMSAAPQRGFVYENSSPWRYDPVPVWTIGVQYDSGRMGQDPRVASTLIRHGNFDFVSNGEVWDPAIERTDLPPSFYLDRKPAFFGEETWPWVVPGGVDVKIHKLPARERFNRLMGLSD